MIALKAVAWLTWRQLFARRRMWLAIAIAVFPLILTFFYRLASEDREGDRLEFMMAMSRDVIIAVLLPLTAVVFGTTAFGGEVDDGTLIYLLVKPVVRWRVVVLKYLVAVAVTTVVVCIALLLAWLSLRNEDLPGRFLWAFVVAIFVGAAIYCALFNLLGLVTRRGLIFGLLYIIFFENVMSRNFDGVKSLSARELAISVAQWAGKGVVKWPTETVPMTTVWTVAALVTVIALAVGMRKLARYELAERL